MSGFMRPANAADYTTDRIKKDKPQITWLDKNYKREVVPYAAKNKDHCCD